MLQSRRLRFALLAACLSADAAGPQVWNSSEFTFYETGWFRADLLGVVRSRNHLTDAFDDVLDVIRKLDFPFSQCKYLIASHADADHVQALAAAREVLKAKTCAHPQAAELIEAGDTEQTFAAIPAQKFSIPMPPCRIDVKLKEGDKLRVGEVGFDELRHHVIVRVGLRGDDGDLVSAGGRAVVAGQAGQVEPAGGVDRRRGADVQLVRVERDRAAGQLPRRGPVLEDDLAADGVRARGRAAASRRSRS